MARVLCAALLLVCSGIVAAQTDAAAEDDTAPPTVPSSAPTTAGVYLKTYNRLPYVDMHQGNAHRRCDTDGEAISVPVGLEIRVDGAVYVRGFTSEVGSVSMEELSQKRGEVKAFNMGDYRCITYTNEVIGDNFPIAGSVEARILSRSSQYSLYNATVNSKTLKYNLTSSIGPVALSLSQGPEPSEAHGFFVLRPVVRMFVFPPLDVVNQTYTQQPMAVLRAIEFFVPPEEAAIPTTIQLMTKTINSLRFYFPPKFGVHIPTLYEMTYGLPGSNNMPEMIRVPPDSEYEIEGLMPGMAYLLVVKVHYGNTVEDFELEEQTAAAKSTSIPAYTPEGECAVYQEDVGYVVVRLPLRHYVDTPPYRAVKVTLRDAVDGSLLSEGAYDFPGDHKLHCDTCHRSGFVAKISCVEASYNDTNADGLVFQQEVWIRRSFGEPTSLPALQEPYYPTIVRTSANALVARIPKKVSKTSKGLELATVVVANLFSRKVLTIEEIRKPGDNIIVVPDRGDWHVELEYKDLSGKILSTAFQNYCPPKYIHATHKREIGTPRVHVHPNGDIVVNVGHRLYTHSKSHVAEFVVFARDPFSSSSAPFVSASVMGPGDALLQNITRWDSVFLGTSVTTDDGESHYFQTLVRRTGNTQNSPSVQTQPSVRSLTPTGFTFRIPPLLRHKGRAVLQTEFTLHDTASYDVLRQDTRPAAGSWYVEDIATPYVTAKAHTVFESTNGTMQGRHSSTFFFVPRQDGLPVFKNSGKIQVFFQRVHSPPTQRVVIRVPYEVTGLPGNGTLHRIDAFATDGTTGPVLFTKEISAGGDYIINNVPLAAEVVVKMTVFTSDGEEERKMFVREDSWAVDPVTKEKPPTLPHVFGDIKVIPHFNGIIVHVPTRLTDEGAMIRDALITVHESQSGLEWTATGKVVTSATTKGYSVASVFVPATLSVDVEVIAFAYTGDTLGTFHFHVESVPTPQFPMPLHGLPSLYVVDDFSLLLTVPQKLQDRGKRVKSASYSIVNADTHEPMVLDASVPLGQTAISFTSPLHGRFDVDVKTVTVDNAETTTMIRVIHDDVVISDHMAPMPDSGFPFAMPFMRPVKGQCEVIVRVPKMTASAGRELVEVKVTVLDDTTGAVVATPTLAVGEDNFLYLQRRLCTGQRHHSVTLKIVALDIAGAEHFISNQVVSKTGGLPPLPSTGHPRVLKTEKGRVFAMVPPRLSAADTATMGATVTWKFFSNGTQSGFTQVKPGYTELDGLTLGSVFDVQFDVEVEDQGTRVKEPPAKAHSFTFQVSSIFKLPAVASEDKPAPYTSVVLMRNHGNLIVIVPEALSNGDVVASAEAKVLSAEPENRVLVERVLAVGENEIEGIDDGVEHTVVVTVHAEPSPEQQKVEEAKKFAAEYKTFRFFVSKGTIGALEDVSAFDRSAGVPQLARGNAAGTVVVLLPRALANGDYVANGVVNVLSPDGRVLKKATVARNEEKVVSLASLGDFDKGVYVQAVCRITDPPVAAELSSRKFMVEVVRVSALEMLPPGPMPASGPPEVYRTNSGDLVFRLPKKMNPLSDPVAAASVVVLDTSTDKMLRRLVVPAGDTKIPPADIGIDPMRGYAFDFTISLEGDQDIARDELSDDNKKTLELVHKFVAHLNRVASLPDVATLVVPEFGAPMLARTENADEIAVVIPPKFTPDGNPVQVAKISFVNGHTVEARYAANSGRTDIKLDNLGLDLARAYDVVMELDTSLEAPTAPRKYAFTVHDVEALPEAPDLPSVVGPPAIFHSGEPNLVIVRIPNKPSMLSTDIESATVALVNLDGTPLGSTSAAVGDNWVDLGSLGVKAKQPVRFLIDEMPTPKVRVPSMSPEKLPTLEPVDVPTEQVMIGRLLDFPSDLSRDEMPPYGFPEVFKLSPDVCTADSCVLLARVHPHLFPPHSPVAVASLELINAVRFFVQYRVEVPVGKDFTLDLKPFNLSRLDQFAVRVVIRASVGHDMDVFGATVSSGFRSLIGVDGSIPVIAEEPRVSRTLQENTIALQVPSRLHNVQGVASAEASIFRLGATDRAITSASLLEKELTLSPGRTLLADIVRDWHLDWFEEGLSLGISISMLLDNGRRSPAFDFVISKATMASTLPLTVDPTSELTDLKLRANAQTNEIEVTCGGVRVTKPTQAHWTISNPVTGSIFLERDFTCPSKFSVTTADAKLLASTPFNFHVHIASMAAKPFIMTVPEKVLMSNPNVHILVAKADALPRLEESTPEEKFGNPHAYQNNEGDLVVNVPPQLTEFGHHIVSYVLKVYNENSALIYSEEHKPGLTVVPVTPRLESGMIELSLEFESASNGQDGASLSAMPYDEEPIQELGDDQNDPFASGGLKDQNFVVSGCTSIMPAATAPNAESRTLMLWDGKRVVLRVPLRSSDFFVLKAVVVARDTLGNRLGNLTLSPGDHPVNPSVLGIDCSTDRTVVVSTNLLLDMPPVNPPTQVTLPFVLKSLPPKPSALGSVVLGDPQIFLQDGHKVMFRCPDRVTAGGHAVERCDVRVEQGGQLAKSFSLLSGLTQLELTGLPYGAPYSFNVVVVERGGSEVPDTLRLTVTNPLLLPPKDSDPAAEPLPKYGPPMLLQGDGSTLSAPKLLAWVPEQVVKGGASISSVALTITDLDDNTVKLTKTLGVGETLIDYAKAKLKSPHQYLVELKLRIADDAESGLQATEDGTLRLTFNSLVAVVTEQPYLSSPGSPVLLPVSRADKVLEVNLPGTVLNGPWDFTSLKLWHSRADELANMEPVAHWSVLPGQDKYLSFASSGVCFATPCYLAVTGVSKLGRIVVLADADVQPPTDDQPDPVVPIAYSDVGDEIMVLNNFDGQSVRVEVIDASTLEPAGFPQAHFRGGMQLAHSVFIAMLNNSKAAAEWGLDDSIIPGKGALKIGGLEPVSNYEVRCFVLQEDEDDDKDDENDNNNNNNNNVDVVVIKLQTANYMAPIPAVVPPLPVGVPKTGGLVPKDMESLKNSNFGLVSVNNRDIKYVTTFTTADENFGSISRSTGGAVTPEQRAQQTEELGRHAASAAAQAGGVVGLTCDQSDITVRAGYSSILFDLPKLFGGAPVCLVKVTITQPNSANVLFATTLAHPETTHDDAAVSLEAPGLEHDRAYDVQVRYASCFDDTTVCERTATTTVRTSAAMKPIDPAKVPGVVSKNDKKVCVRSVSPFPANLDLLRIGYEDTEYRDPIIIEDQELEVHERFSMPMGTNETCAHNLQPGRRYRFVFVTRDKVDNRGKALRTQDDKYTEKCVWLTTNKDPAVASKLNEPHWFYVDQSTVYLRLPSNPNVVNYTIERVNYEADGERIASLTEIYHGLGYPDEYGPFYRVAALAAMTNYTFKIEREFLGGGSSVVLVSVTTDSDVLDCIAGRPTDDMLPIILPGDLNTPFDAFRLSSRDFDVKFVESWDVRMFGTRYALTYNFDVATLQWNKEAELGGDFIPFNFYRKLNMPSPREGGRIITVRGTVPGHTYRIRLRVRNVWGETSAPGVRHEYVTASEAPEPPPFLRIEDVAPRQLIATWGPVFCPAEVFDAKGSLVPHSYCNGNDTTLYVLEMSPGPTKDINVYPSDFLNPANPPPFVEVFRGYQLGTTIYDLTPATNYTLRVRAMNEQGFSAYLYQRVMLAGSQIRTHSTIPEHITNLRNTTFLSEEVTLEWDKPRHNGLFIMYFNVFMRPCTRYGECNNGAWDLACSKTIDTKCTVFNLTAGDFWQFRVTAVNCKGSTDLFDDVHWVLHEEQLNIRAHPAPPGQPFDLIQNARTSTALDLQFTIADRDNGEEVLFYSIECDGGAYCLSDQPTVHVRDGVAYNLKDGATKCQTLDNKRWCEPVCHRNWSKTCDGAWVNGTYVVSGACEGNSTLSGTAVDTTPPGIPLAARAIMFGPASMGKFQQVAFCGKFAGASRILASQQFESMSVAQLESMINSKEVSAKAAAITALDLRKNYLQQELMARTCIQNGNTLRVVVPDLRPATTYRCRAIEYNREGYSMYSRSADPFTFVNSHKYGLFDYFRTLDERPEPVKGLEVEGPHYEWPQWTTTTNDASSYFVGKLMTPDNLPAKSHPQAQLSDLRNPDRVTLKIHWTNPAGTEDEHGRAVHTFLIARSRQARTRSSTLRDLRTQERSAAEDFATEVPAYRRLAIADACPSSADTAAQFRCYFEDDMLFPDHVYEYKITALTSLGSSNQVSLIVKTTHGHPAKTACVPGEVYSKAFEVKCITGDDWGSLIREVTYRVKMSEASETFTPLSLHPDPACVNQQGGVEVTNSCPFTRVPGLEPATTYTVDSWAHNEIGDSDVSPVIEVTTIAGKPKAPETPDNLPISLAPPPAAELDPEVIGAPATSPTSRRVAIQYTTPESKGADLTYCNVRVRGVWFGSTEFNKHQIKCEPGVTVPSFKEDDFMQNGYVKPGADETNKDLLAMGCWVEERVYRHGPEDTFAMWQGFDEKQKKAAMARWGFSADNQKEVLGVKDASAQLLKLYSFGGVERDGGAIDALFSVNDTNPYSTGSQPKWVGQKALRYWVLPLVHNTANNIAFGAPGRLSPLNPHLFASTSYQVSVSCANRCDYNQLMEEENFERKQRGEAPLDTSIGEKYCESEYSVPMIFTTKADPPAKPAVPTVEFKTSDALAIRYLMPHPLADPILNWTLSIECVEGWCPEAMCDEITHTGPYVDYECSAVSSHAGYCPGTCTGPREFNVPHCTSKKCADKDDSPDVFEALCQNRHVNCAQEASTLDMGMMQGTCGTDSADTRALFKKLCCSWEDRLAHDWKECYDFGSDFACSECFLGEPYGLEEMKLTAQFLVGDDTRVAQVKGCSEDCDDKFRGSGCCKPQASARLMPGTTYKFKSMGTNSAGTSPWSDEVTVTTCAVPPNSVRNVRARLIKSTASPGSKKKVKLTWEYPGFDGGSRVYRYRVQYKEISPSSIGWQEVSSNDLTCSGWGDGVKVTCEPTEANQKCGESTAATEIVIPDLTAGRVYKFMVKAVNAFGESEWEFLDLYRDGSILGDNQQELMRDIITNLMVDVGTDFSEPVGLLTGGDLPNTADTVPDVHVRTCGFDSCTLTWTEPSLIESEHFYYGLDWRNAIASSSCSESSDPQGVPASCIETASYMGGSQKLDWYGDASCQLLNGQKMSAKDGSDTLLVTKCEAVTISGMSRSVTDWTQTPTQEKNTLASKYRMYQFKLRLLPAFEGSCQLDGASCGPRHGSRWSEFATNSDVVSHCKCSGNGDPDGSISEYVNPFKSGTGTPFCKCACHDPFSGSDCSVKPVVQHCHCVGDPHCDPFAYAGGASRHFDFYCPGEHIFYTSAVHGVVNVNGIKFGRERIHNWMHRLGGVTASNKIALRFYDDSNRDHTVAFERDDQGTGHIHYAGPGPLKDANGQTVCSGAACACWGTWSNRNFQEPLSVQFTAYGKQHSLQVWYTKIHNEATDTEITASVWSSFGLNNHYLHIYIHSHLPADAATVEQLNQQMTNPKYTGMCGMEGAAIAVARDTRPQRCTSITNIPDYPQFITEASQSIFTKYGSNDYCTYFLHNGEQWKTDTFRHYSNFQYLAVSEGAHKDQDFFSNEVEMAHFPKSYDILKAEKELRTMNAVPLIPHGLSRAGLERLAKPLHDTPTSVTDKTDEFIRLRRADTHLDHMREQLVQLLIQDDATVETEVVGRSTNGKHMWRAVIVESPIDEFVLINSQDQVDAQAAERENMKPEDPNQQAMSSYEDAPSVDLEEKLNTEKPDACPAAVFERALTMCAGLDRELANCVEDVCLTDDDTLAKIAAANEKTRAARIDAAAQQNFDLASVLNQKLAEKMSQEFAQRGVECLTIATGDELWNVAPFDKNIPAWTYSRYVDAKKVYLEQHEQTAADSVGDNEGSSNGTTSTGDIDLVELASAAQLKSSPTTFLEVLEA